MMDIKKAFNTPVLTNKIIGNNTISQNITGSIKNQSVTITPNILYDTENSTINITRTKISYSKLGLLNLPAISTSAKNSSDLLKYSYEPSIVTNNLSILDTNSKLKSIYDNIISTLDNSIKTEISISKETYLLLSLQSLTDFIIELCNQFLNSFEEKSPDSNSHSINIIIKLFDSLLGISKSIKLLNALIGETTITSKYADRILNQLSSSLLSIEFIINNLYIINDLSINTETLYTMNSTLKQCKELLIPSINAQISFSKFATIISHLIDCISLLKDQLIQLESLSSIIYSIQNIINLITYDISSISLSYYNLRKDYLTIIGKIKSACDCAKSISFTSQSPDLFLNFNSNILLTKSYLKNLTNINIDEPLDINNTLVNSIVSQDQDIVLSLSFYVYNLKINISGTIDSISFEGTILYPELYKLSFFGINDVFVNTKISIPSGINKFNISQQLALDLNITDITLYPQYSASSSSTLIADITFNLLVNGEIFITSLLPIIIVK